MPDNFTPSPPDFNIYWSDTEGKIDFKARDRQCGLWKKEKDGKTYFTGNKLGRRFVMYPVVPRDEQEEEEW